MPVITELEIDEIRKTDQILPIILISTDIYADENILKRSCDKYYKFVPKPFSWSELCNAVDELLAL